MSLLPVGIGSSGGYTIDRSVRLRSSASAYFNRTPASAGNRKTWTWSGWVKRGSFKYCLLFAAGNTNDIWNSSSVTDIGWLANTDSFSVYSAGVFLRTTSQVFRDPSAWYHIVVAIDTTQATASNRVKLYVNGIQVTAFSTSNDPTLDADTYVNAAHNHVIGGQQTNVANAYYDGYQTEVNFIDGQALTPSSFGETDTITGSWVAKKYTGSYGTNGFFLTFADNSAATSTTIGKDYSGNGNNWTPNNISVTAGTTYDSMLDVPAGNGYADGGNGRGNYAVINPLYAYGTLANGNLDYYTTTNYQGGYATMAVSGKIYFEVTCASPTGGGALVGFVKNASIVPSTTNFFTGTGFYGAIFSNTLNYYLNGSSDGLDHGNVTSSMLQFAVDADTGKCWVGSNNTWFDSGSPATGANPAWTISLSSGDLLFPAFCAGNSTYTLNVNFGQRPFSYTPPTGFKALNTTNLPTPTVGATSTTQAANYFAATLYTGNGSTQSITNTVNGVSFQPDLVWQKERSDTGWHNLVDAVRGAGYRLFSNTTNAESYASTNLTSFNSNGFSVGNDVDWNQSGQTSVAWQWKANGAGSTNTAGSITSTVSANTTSGFSIATTTGTGGTGTIGHGLGAVPQFIMCFRRNTAADHYCYHQAIGNTNFLILNSTAASAASVNLWNNTTPTSTVFSVGNTNNNSGDTYVHYIFAPIPGYSAFGSFVGNGSSDGPMVYCGFRPTFVMAKLSSGTGDWNMVDDTRQVYNDASGNPVLRANLSSAEEDVDTMQGQMDLLSNGFKLRSNNSSLNSNGGTIIYAAFAESPFKFSNAR